MAFKLISIGEILWDLLPTGRQLGGAPANFAYHARALGADARVISRIGDDALGHEVIDRLKQLHVPTDCIQIDPSAPTGTVTVELSSTGDPRFTIHDNVAWDHLSGESAARLAVSQADAVCFGTLAQRHEPSRSTIHSLVSAAGSAALRILDVNLRQHYYSPKIINESLAFANVLKLNETELPRLAEFFALKGDQRSQISRLAGEQMLRCIAYTRGPRGSLLFCDGKWSDHPGIATKVVDAVGAGDAFTAALTLGLLLKWDLDAINQHANEIAAYVCSRPGATPELPNDLRAFFSPLAI